MSKLQQLKYLIAPLLFGCFFAIAPLLINFLLLFWYLILEIIFVSKHGFCLLGAKRVSLFFAIVFSAYIAPLKYLDQSVEPRNFMFSENGYSSSLASENINIHFSSVYNENDIDLIGGRMSLKSFIKSIEQQTGLKHKIYYCGTGANILFGGHPMLGIRFNE